MEYEFKNGLHFVVCRNPYTGQKNAIKTYKSKRSCMAYIARNFQL